MIELDAQPGLPEGSRVKVAIEQDALTLEEKRWLLHELSDWGRFDPTFIAAVEDVERERGASDPREVDFDAVP